MATLNNIRSRSGLLISVIGLAMLAFIFTDFFNSQRTGGPSDIFIGEINGKKILPKEFQIKVEEAIELQRSQNPNFVLNESSRGQVRNQVWNQYVRDVIMNSQYEILGIDLSNQEWVERLSGNNVHPEIRKIPLFQDPATGMFSGDRAKKFVQDIIRGDESQTERRLEWIGYQDYIIRLIKQSKYDALISKSMYVTNQHANTNILEKSSDVIFEYVKIPYTLFSDSLFIPSDKEIKNYYNDHKDNYKQEASKDIEFVVFEVFASLEDDIETRKYLEELRADFSNDEDYNSIIRRHSDNTNIQLSFNTKDQLQDNNWQDLFDMDEGSVIGPYLFSEGLYRIAKLVDVEFRPDSVKARHILIPVNESINLDSANNIVERLKNKINSGADFGLLAEQYSEDKVSSLKGGDLGWFKDNGRMVPEFSEVCFSSDRGDLKIVETQFGVHLIELLKHSRKVKQVKIAYVDRSVNPSTETFENYRTQAMNFAGKLMTSDVSFDSLVISQNLVKKSDFRVQPERNSIYGLPNSREIIKWMNNAEEGSISDIFELDNSLVVAYLVNSRKEGYMPMNTVREEIISLVLTEKKYQHIESIFNDLDLESIASKNNIDVIKSNKANFTSSNIEGIGPEQELIGQLFGSAEGVITGPVRGMNSAYFFKINKKNISETKINLNQEKNQMRFSLQSSSSVVSYKSLESNANLTDNRANIY